MGRGRKRKQRSGVERSGREIGERVKEGVGVDGLKGVSQVTVRLPSRNRGVEPPHEVLIAIGGRRG